MTIKLNWKFEDGIYVLYRQGYRAPVLCVVPDKTYPSMWRIKTKAGVLSDMVNLSRAKDSAFGLALDEYDRQTRVEKPQEARTAVILTGMGAGHSRRPKRVLRKMESLRVSNKGMKRHYRSERDLSPKTVRKFNGATLSLRRMYLNGLTLCGQAWNNSQSSNCPQP